MKINGYLNIEQSNNTSGISDILSKLNAGDIVRAKVLEIAAGQLMLKLADGTSLSAATLTAVDVKAGDTVDFVIKSNVNNQIIMETLKGEGEERKAQELEINIKKELIDIGVKPDSHGVNIAREIKANGIPLDKQSFDKVIDSIIKFKNLSPEKAAYLISKNMIPEEKNISCLNQIVEHKLKIGAEVEDLFKLLSDIKEEDTKALLEKQLSTSESKGLKNESLINTKITNTANTSSTPNTTNTPNTANIPTAANTSNASSTANPQNTHNTSNTEVLVRDIVDKEFGIFNGDKSAVEQKEIIVKLLGNAQDKIKNPEKLLELIKSELKDYEGISPNNKGSIDSVLKNIINEVRGNAYNIDAEDNFSTQRDNLNAKVSEDSFKNVLEKLFLKFDSDSVKEDVKNIYKDTYERLEIIKNTVEQSSITNKDVILAKVDNLQSNIKFINEINNHSAYLQIPITIFDKHASGELYVLKRDGSKKSIDPKNSTVFLSLNTPNLGQVDSLVSVDRKNISLNMRVENEKIIDFIKTNYLDLYNGLSEKGYKLIDVKYRLIAEEINLLNINEVVERELVSKKKNIDFRI